MEKPDFNNYVREQQANELPPDMRMTPVVQPQHSQSSSNPFAMEQYQDVRMPDVPIAYGGGMVDTLLSDDGVPDKIKKDYWYVFNKDNVLTFLDEERKRSKLLNLDIMKIDVLNSIPYYDYTFERELEFGIIRNVFETKLDRALGFKGTNVKNERIVLQSQFTEQRQINENDSSLVREGFFKKLLGRR